MKPDRSNYEIWLIDWLDGTLTPEQAELFRTFLASNPDLKEEAESLSMTTLSPGNRSFPGKDLLKKTARELNPSQVEYLSVAYLENDLSPEQSDDLKQKIDQDRQSGELFEAIRKTKLVPLKYEYMYKNRLKKHTAAANILRLSVMGLSVAAAIALVILSFIVVPRFISEKKNNAAQNIIQVGEPFIVTTEVLKAPLAQTAAPDFRSEKPISAIPEKVSANVAAQQSLKAVPDTSIVIKREMPGYRITSLPPFNIDVIGKSVNYSLIASITEFKELSIDDERNRLSRFLARTFREKILRDETGSDAPLKSYDIASAGINGLNKLFGWDMALVKINDEEGYLKSIYFSSRLLKVNAPVRKTEALQ